MIIDLVLKHNFKDIRGDKIEIPSSLNLYLTTEEIVNVSWDESEIVDCEHTNPKHPEKIIDIRGRGVYFNDEYANGRLDLIKDKIIYAQAGTGYDEDGVFLVTAATFSDTVTINSPTGNCPDNVQKMDTNTSGSSSHTIENSYTYSIMRPAYVNDPKPIAVSRLYAASSITAKEIQTLLSYMDNNAIVKNVSDDQNITFIHTDYMNRQDDIIKELGHLNTKNPVLVYKNKNSLPKNVMLRFPFHAAEATDHTIVICTFLISELPDSDKNDEHRKIELHAIYASIEDDAINYDIEQELKQMPRSVVPTFIHEELLKRNIGFAYYDPTPHDTVCIYI